MNTWPLLAEIVAGVRCKPGWEFALSDGSSRKPDPFSAPELALVIYVTGPDSRSNGEVDLRISHNFPVPVATYNAKTWRRWIFECCRRVENHELGEWFVADGERPFAPLHGPGEDPYTVHEFRDVVDAHTNQEGTIER